MDHDFAELLKASSLGSPAARRIRSLANPEVVAEVRKRMTERSKRSARADISRGSLPETTVLACGTGSGKTGTALVSRLVCGVVTIAPNSRIVPELQDRLKVIYPGYDAVFDGLIGLTWGHANDTYEALTTVQVLRSLADTYDRAQSAESPKFVVFLYPGSMSSPGIDIQHRHRLFSELARIWLSSEGAADEIPDCPGEQCTGLSAVLSPASSDRSADERWQIVQWHRREFGDDPPEKLSDHVWLFLPGHERAAVKCQLKLRAYSPHMRRHLQRVLGRLWQSATQSSGFQTRSLVETVVVCSITENQPDIVSELIRSTTAADTQVIDTCTSVIGEIADLRGRDPSGPGAANRLMKTVTGAAARWGESEASVQSSAQEKSKAAPSRSPDSSAADQGDYSPVEIHSLQWDVIGHSSCFAVDSTSLCGLCDEGSGRGRDTSGLGNDGFPGVNRDLGSGSACGFHTGKRMMEAFGAASGDKECERTTWLAEDDDIWAGDDDVPPIVG